MDCTQQTAIQSYRRQQNLTPDNDSHHHAFIRTLTHSHNIPTTTSTTPSPADSIERSFTLKELRHHEDWPEWQQSGYKQLNQFHSQGMFSDPMIKPTNANALPIIWRFNIKHDSTKKARMVCDGSKKHKEKITFRHTYAN